MFSFVSMCTCRGLTVGTKPFDCFLSCPELCYVP